VTKDVIVPIIVTLLTVGGASGIAWVVKAIRGQGRIDAAESLGKTAREWADEFKQEAIEARAELRACRTEAHALAEEIRQLRLAILHPAATIDGLRELVRAGQGGGENGSGVNLRRP
jgi:hypothetical protein